MESLLLIDDDAELCELVAELLSEEGFAVEAARVESVMGAQQRLIHDISHELRSPLARLSVALDLARRRAGAEASPYHDRIERETGRLNEMIGQLLTLARWETGVDAVRRESFDLAALVRDVAEGASFEAHSRGREVRVSAWQECRLSGSPALLLSAIENVVRNAIRHTPEGTAAEMTLACPREVGDGHAVITVRDRGPGVPEGALADIFRPFYRVDEARDRESGGAGLGLAITDGYVRLHGGTVTAANAPGGGLLVEMRRPPDRRGSS